MKRIGCFFLCICIYGSMIVTHAFAYDVQSEFVYIYNVDEQQDIYEKNAREKMYPASMTKIMTALIVLENQSDLQKIIEVPAKTFIGLAEASASVAGLRVGEQISVEDLLYGVMLPSGADATRALAYDICDSEEAFVELMNKKAEDLQLAGTHFVNTSGLHDDNHYSTARDMAIIVQEALKYDQFKTIFNSYQHTSKPTNKHPEGLRFTSTKYSVMFTHQFDPTLLQGGKTGFTLEGGLCFASLVRVNRASYIIITGNAGQNVESAQHMVDTYELIEQLGLNYTKEAIFKAGDIVATPSLYFGKANKVQAVVKEDVDVFKKNTDATSYEIQTDTLFAPIEEGEEIGTLKVIREGKLDKEVLLYAQQGVDVHIIFVSGVLVILCIIVAGTIFAIRRHRRYRKHKH